MIEKDFLAKIGKDKFITQVFSNVEVNQDALDTISGSTKLLLTAGYKLTHEHIYPTMTVLGWVLQKRGGE